MPATARPETRATDAFQLIPARAATSEVTITVSRAVPESVTALGVPVAADGDVPRERVDIDRATLEASGFGGSVGETLVLPRVTGPTMIEIGVGARASLGHAAIRDAAAAFARAASRHSRVAVDLTGVDSALEARVAAQAVVEGVLLARYRYRSFVSKPDDE